MAELSKVTIKEIEVIHHKHIPTFYGGTERYARLVVWAITDKGERVWVRTVEGGLDSLDVSIKVAIAQEFFKELVGHKIRFRMHESVLFAKEESFPKKFLAPYPEIKKAMWKWVKANCGEEIEQLRTRKSAKAAETLKANAEAKEADRRRRAAKLGLPEDASWHKIKEAEEEEYERRQELLFGAERKRRAASLGLPEDTSWPLIYEVENKQREAEYELRRQKELEERRKNALWLLFRKGRNPKHGTDQWETRYDGLLHVLRREDVYDPSEGKIPVEEDFDLVPGRIVLMKRI